jgi:hypothetical protein
MNTRTQRFAQTARNAAQNGRQAGVTAQGGNANSSSG